MSCVSPTPSALRAEGPFLGESVLAGKRLHTELAAPERQMTGPEERDSPGVETTGLPSHSSHVPLPTHGVSVWVPPEAKPRTGT